MGLREAQLASGVDDAQGAADAAAVGGDVDAAMDRVQLDRDKLADVAGAPQLAHRCEEAARLRGGAGEEGGRGGG